MELGRIIYLLRRGDDKTLNKYLKSAVHKGHTTPADLFRLALYMTPEDIKGSK